jgi:hypothetical protein
LRECREGKKRGSKTGQDQNPQQATAHGSMYSRSRMEVGTT